MNIRAARATDVYQFAFFETPDAAAHVFEVEQWIRQSAWAWLRDSAPGEDRRLLVGDDDGEIVAVAAHALVEPNVRYLMVAAVHDGHRGRGLGRALIEATVLDMQQQTPGCGIYGLVDPQNLVMQHLAESMGASRGGDDLGYLTFRSPPGM